MTFFLSLRWNDLNLIKEREGIPALWTILTVLHIIVLKVTLTIVLIHCFFELILSQNNSILIKNSSYFSIYKAKKKLPYSALYSYCFFTEYIIGDRILSSCTTNFPSGYLSLNSLMLNPPYHVFHPITTQRLLII